MWPSLICLIWRRSRKEEPWSLTSESVNLISVSGKTRLNNASRYRVALILWHPYLCLTPMLLCSSTTASLSRQLSARSSYTWIYRHPSMLRSLAATTVYGATDEYVEDSEPERVELRKKQRKTTSQREATKHSTEETRNERPPTSPKLPKAKSEASIIEISGALTLPLSCLANLFINALGRRLRFRQLAISQDHSQEYIVRFVNISKQIPNNSLSLARCTNDQEREWRSIYLEISNALRSKCYQHLSGRHFPQGLWPWPLRLHESGCVPESKNSAHAHAHTSRPKQKQRWWSCSSKEHDTSYISVGSI